MLEVLQPWSLPGYLSVDTAVCRCQIELAEAEDMLSHLRAQQRQAVDQHGHGLSQISMMTDIVQILQLKQQLYESNTAALASDVGRRGGSAGSGRGVIAGIDQAYNTNVMVL